MKSRFLLLALNCYWLQIEGEKSSVNAAQSGVKFRIASGLVSTGGRMTFLGGITNVFKCCTYYTSVLKSSVKSIDGPVDAFVSFNCTF